MTTILVADVGGTKTDLALFSIEGDLLVPIREERLVNADYGDLCDLVRAFTGRDAQSALPLTAATFAVAAPVSAPFSNRRAVMTNLSWTVDADRLSALLGGSPVHLINDLEATGWGVALLKDDEFVTLQEGEANDGNACLIAAGTGLGESVLFFDGAGHIPLATEGGHADFAPRGGQESLDEVALLGYLMEKYDGHVSYERLLSGMGLENIYDFLLESDGGDEATALTESFRKDGKAAVISAEALAGGDGRCSRALAAFVSIYGAEAGNLALKSLATGGVYVAGGIAPKIIDALLEGEFMKAFREKGRLAPLLSSMPVKVVMNERTALLGAARHCALGVEKKSYVLDRGLSR